MKTLLKIIGVAALLATVTVHAQSNNVPTIEGIGTTVSGWLTSENPANRYQDVLTWTGPLYQNGSPIANETGGSYDLWRSAGKNYFPYTGSNSVDSTIFIGPELRGRFGAPGLKSVQFGPEIGWQQNDVRLGFAIDFVNYSSTTDDVSKTKKRWEIDFFGDKMVSKNSALGLVVGFQQHEKFPLFMPSVSVSFGNGSGFMGLF